ncbi:FUSC family protein [Streptomyces sp. NBC_00878]|uniref:FUSC family protein n=1 Tax=Streptomyces sp. NBC_00878 TaxID=2975854 RepID=UPI002250623C|nr:FUSC family protein [Streptomyces sp. NBC_00878]MCX4909571.1 FUSC family protein [Streptomyces sp. NBC_00878]
MPRPFSAVSVALPPWLAHALRAQRGPVPWNAVVRGALSAGPLLLVAVLVGRESVGVMAALGAMFAGINDRPGSRRAAVHWVGVPALAGAAGLVVGTYAGEGFGAVPLTLVLTGLGLLAGAVSAAGTVASGAGTQLLVAAAIGAGMPLPDPGWQRALFFLAGAGWLIVLRLVLPTPGALAQDFRFDGERVAVAKVYDAIAELLSGVGGAEAGARRAALTAALDHAQDALAGPRLRRYASSSAERRLRAQYAAALPLAEAATALAWAGDALPARTAQGPRRLAVAVRTGEPSGPLPAPARSVPGLRALDDALLHAAETFDRGGRKTDGGSPDGKQADGSSPGRKKADANPLDRGAEQTAHKGLHIRPLRAKAFLRTVTGTGGREYGFRVALCYGAGVAVAQALHHVHWYWLPVTAVFLVKPDLGPLVSRVLNRAAGTVLGALVFAGFAAVLPRPEGLVALVALSGALIPVATRHFAAQTAVVTVLVLALVMVGGEPEASWSRIGETLLACAIVLIVGHLPVPGQRGGNVRARLTAATDAAHAYLTHVLSGADDRAARWALRREAYRRLAEARAAIDRASAELPTLARHTEGTGEVAATLERLVDTTTACAVHLDDTGRLTPRHTERLATLLDELVEQRERAGLADPPADLLSA